MAGMASAGNPIDEPDVIGQRLQKGPTMKASQPGVPQTAATRRDPNDLKPDTIADGSDPDALMPHERDESAHHTADEPSPVIQRAFDDLEEGQVDTDLHNTPGLDAERRRELLQRQP